MSVLSASAMRRAQRLLRCYPATWRARYGEEFAQLLIDDMIERPRSLRRTADVLCTGLLTRLSSAGLAGAARDPVAQMRATLSALGYVLAVFLVAGIAMWSQLAIGWQWSPPASPATRTAMFVMSGAVLGLAVLGLLAVALLAVAACRALVRGGARALLGPMLLVAFGIAALVIGSHHFARGWPGTGGHPWADRGLVPAPVASLAWAATLWVNSYWAHPGALLGFPAAEIAWMAASPLALALVIGGATTAVRRLALSTRVLRCEMWLGAGAAAAMAAFLAGACSWVLSGGPAPRQLYRVGAIDGIGLALMAAALVVAIQAVHRALAVRAVRRSAG
jgi:hypothetical protein